MLILIAFFYFFFDNTLLVLTTGEFTTLSSPLYISVYILVTAYIDYQ